jgi:hypothetical protein
MYTDRTMDLSTALAIIQRRALTRRESANALASPHRPNVSAEDRIQAQINFAIADEYEALIAEIKKSQ